jgi:hypothetical protein
MRERVPFLSGDEAVVPVLEDPEGDEAVPGLVLEVFSHAGVEFKVGGT